MWKTAAVGVVALSVPASAEPEMTIQTVFVSQAIINLGSDIGLGLAVRYGDVELSGAALGSVYPVCGPYIGCVGFWSAGVSAAIDYRIDERHLVGARVGHRLEGLLGDDSSQHSGSSGFAVGELGYRPHAGSRIEIIVGAGARSGGAPIALAGVTVAL
jgi:hypothetical protein